MSISIGMAASDELRPRITVIGIGGAGGNAIANMMGAEIEGVEFIVANTDAQALSSSPTENRIQLGPEITNGLGAGARPEVGKAAAEETVADIEAALEGVNMVFIAAGMGGGTGTGAAPVIAEAARRKGVLTVGVVTKPFLFEGTRRMRAAEAGIEELQRNVDTLIVIPNQNLFLIASPDTTFKEAFQMADEVLQQGVRSITDLMVMPGLINLDFADVRSVMSEMGKAMMGTGEGEGENRAKDAAEQAIANPLLDGVSMQGAKGVIISIIGGEDMKLFEVDGAANHIRSLVDEDANIIWGSAFNPDLEGRIRVSVVATGIEQDDSGLQPASSLAAAIPSARAPQRPVLDLMDENEAPTSDTAPVFTPAPSPAPIPDEGPDESPAPITLTPPDPLPEETRSSEMDLAHGAALPDTHPTPEVYEPEPDSEIQSGFDAELDLEEDADERDELALGALSEDDTEDDASPVSSLKPRAIFSDEDDETSEDAYPEEAKPFDLTGMQEGDNMGELEDEDVDEIVDPLAGLRGASDEPLDLTGSETSEAPADGANEREQDAVYSEIDEASEGDASDGEPAEASDPTPSDPSPEPESGGATTLFERMANLSRSSGSDDEEEDDDEDTTALSIPRFLGRQNNQ
ncbi:MAG: cell division protein FtsZ [Pseudomonadota bacterium]